MELHFSSGTARGRGVPARWLGRRRAASDARLEDASDPATAAWLAVVPTAALTLLALLLLGPPLGALLLPDSHARFLSFSVGERPESTEQGRFLIALAAPLILSGLTLLLVRRPTPARAVLLARLVELGGVLLVVACFVAQRLQDGTTSITAPRPIVYFTLPTIAVALVVAVGLAALLRFGPALGRVAGWLAESRTRRIGAAAVALVAVVVTLLPAVYTDHSIENAFEAFSFHLNFTYDETMAVLNGRSPLGDFAAQYASLWPYALAGGMGLLGTGLTTFTVLIAALSGAALLGLYDLLRRVCRSSVAALLLFLPLLATSAFRLGLYIAIFLTHVAAIGVATVRAMRRDDDVLLTGMLAWSGVFGLGAGSYYVGHSLSELLIDTFPCWALSLALLTVVTVRSLVGAQRWPSPAAFACLVGFGLLVCSLGQTPAPWRQIERISSQGPPSFAQPIGEGFVRQHVRPGERVLIIAALGHRIAENLDVEDVEPYTGAKSIFTLEQLEDSLAALRRERGTKLFVEPANAYGDLRPVLASTFELRDQGEGIQLWVAR